MEAILRIEMPETCDKCPMYLWTESICVALKDPQNDLFKFDIFKGKPKYCPLIMADKRENMSSLKRKIEICRIIEDFLASFRAELEQIDEDFLFRCENDDEIHSRLYCLRHTVPVVLPKEEGFSLGDITETLPDANEYKLRFFGDFCLEGDELNRFFDYIDRVKKEVQGT